MAMLMCVLIVCMGLLSSMLLRDLAFRELDNKDYSRKRMGRFITATTKIPLPITMIHDIEYIVGWSHCKSFALLWSNQKTPNND